MVILRSILWCFALSLLGSPVLAQPATAPATAADSKPAGELNWKTDVDAALAEAQRSSKPVLIDFTAKWCAPCQKYDAVTFADDDVMKELARFVIVRVDATDTEKVQAVLNRFGVATFPTVLLIAPNVKLDKAQRIRTYLPPEELLLALQTIK